MRFLSVKLLSTLGLAIALSACQNPFKKDSTCNDEQSRQLTTELLQKHLQDTSTATLKTLITEGAQSGFDLARIRAAIKQFQFQLQDVRTSNDDPNSSKTFCTAALTVTIPQQLIQDANATRELRGDPNIADAAVLSDLDLQGNTLHYSLEYAIQPTDDGQKIYAESSNAEGVTQFLNILLFDALQKQQIQQQANQERLAAAQAEQDAAAQAADLAAQESMRVAQQQADQQAYLELQQQEAAQRLATANQKLNLVWNSTSKAVRQQLLAEQRVWLKKRELECRLNSADAAVEQQEIVRLRCETAVTEQRVDVLKQLIAQAEANMPDAVTSSPHSSREDAATAQAAANNAAQMQQNLRQLEQQLRSF